MPRRHRLESALPWLLFGVAVVVLLAIAPHRRHGRVFWGDEGTYAAMAESLAHDHDLVFDQRDRHRAVEASLGESPNVILHRVDDHLYYSKPPIYPLLVAPFFLVAGRFAFWIVNLVVLGLAAGLAWQALPEDDQRGWKLVTFLAASAVPPYVVWAMSDVLQFAFAWLAVSAVALALQPSSGGSRRGLLGSRLNAWLLVAGACLGLLVVMRQPQIVLALGVVVAVGLARSWRKAGLLAASAVVVIALAAAASWATVGTWNPYTATRTSFNAGVGYPDNAVSAPVESQLEAKRASHRYDWSTDWDRRTPWSAAYSLVGRHTGLLPYFPLALFLLAWGLSPRRLGRRTVVTLAVVGLWAFYLLYRPDNYFGGSAAVGNRYFLPSYGILFAMLAWAPRTLGSRPGPYLGWRPAFLLSWTLALTFGVSAWASVRDVGQRDPSSQSHTAAGAFRYLPYESTAQETEGQRGRFWGRDYLRFVDRRPKVQAENFVIVGGRRPAEVLLMTHRPGDAFRFRAQAPPGSSLSIQAWPRSPLGDWKVDVDFPDGSPVVVAVPKNDPWVRHPMHFDLETDLAVHRLLFAADTPSPEGGVRVWYEGVRASASADDS